MSDKETLLIALAKLMVSEWEVWAFCNKHDAWDNEALASKRKGIQNTKKDLTTRLLEVDPDALDGERIIGLDSWDGAEKYLIAKEIPIEKLNLDLSILQVDDLLILEEAAKLIRMTRFSVDENLIELRKILEG